MNTMIYENKVKNRQKAIERSSKFYFWVPALLLATELILFDQSNPSAVSSILSMSVAGIGIDIPSSGNMFASDDTILSKPSPVNSPISPPGLSALLLCFMLKCNSPIFIIY